MKRPEEEKRRSTPRDLDIYTHTISSCNKIHLMNKKRDTHKRFTPFTRTQTFSFLKTSFFLAREREKRTEEQTERERALAFRISSKSTRSSFSYLPSDEFHVAIRRRVDATRRRKVEGKRKREETVRGRPLEREREVAKVGGRGEAFGRVGARGEEFEAKKSGVGDEERGTRRVGHSTVSVVEAFDGCAVPIYIRETYFKEVGRVGFPSVSRGEHGKSRRDQTIKEGVGGDDPS